MTAGQLAQLTAETVSTLAGQLARVTATIPASQVAGQLARITATIPASALTGQLSRVTASIPATFAVSLSDPGVLEGGIPVTVTAAATGGTPTGWAWSATGGDIVGHGDGSATLTPAPTWDGDPCTVTCVVTGTGAAPGETSRVLDVLEHLTWWAGPTGWLPTVPVLLT